VSSPPRVPPTVINPRRLQVKQSTITRRFTRGANEDGYFRIKDSENSARGRQGGRLCDTYSYPKLLEVLYEVDYAKQKGIRFDESITHGELIDLIYDPPTTDAGVPRHIKFESEMDIESLPTDFLRLIHYCLIQMKYTREQLCDILNEVL
jgi:hypothetical protein